MRTSLHEREISRFRDIQKAIAIVLAPPAISELRILGTRQGVASGYFADPDALARAAARWSGRGMGVYLTLNPVAAELLARAANRVGTYVRHATGERDIHRLRRFLIDFDPVRASGISAAEQEHEAALHRMIVVRLWLRDRGWPTPVISDSGNGGHLVVGIDLPNDKASRHLLGRCLQALSLCFSDDRVVVDVSTAKAAQLWKVPGTLACKGDDLPERPHRLAMLLQCPDRLQTVPQEKLEELAALVPNLRPRAAWAPGSPEFDLSGWIDTHRLPVVATGEWNGGRKWILNPCPWNREHVDRAAYIVQFPSGAIAAGCHHNGCAGKDWEALRNLIEPDRGGSRLASAHSGDSGNSGDEETRPWEAPVPFYEFDLPPFPTDTLPDWLRDYVEAKATETQTPRDLPAMVALSVLAASCAKVVEVEVRPGWVEPLNLYTIVSLEPGNRKSAVFRDAVKPLEDFEEEETRRQVGEIKAAEIRYELKQKQLVQAQAALKKATPEESAACEREVRRCAEELADIKIPVLSRMLADDVTPEKLATLLAEQGGRIAVMSAEGDIFDMMGGRYGQGGMPNFGVFLKGHVGDPIRVDRVNRPTEYIKRPAITLGLTVQPEVLQGLTRHPGFRGRGLLGRLFYSLPKSLMGRRKIKPLPTSIRISAAYRHRIAALLDLSWEKGSEGNWQPEKLLLTSEAEEDFEEFERWIEPQLGPEGELASMRDWGGKVVGGVARIAGLLHMAEHAMNPAPWKRLIRANTIKQAVTIGRYLIVHARAAYAQMGTDPDVEAARHVLTWLTAQGTTTFTKRELYQATKGRFKKVAALQPALTILTEHGYIRPKASAPHPGPGRKPSEAFEVNPTIHAQDPQNPQNTRPPGASTGVDP